MVADAHRYLGIPYLYGGTNPARGLDCSGLTQLVAKDCGVSIPRVTGQQQAAGSRVATLAAAAPGDLVFFGAPVSHHCGIYVGGGQMIHAPHTGTVVKQSAVYEKPSYIRRLGSPGTGAGVENVGAWGDFGSAVGGALGPVLGLPFGSQAGGAAGGAIDGAGSGAIAAAGGVLSSLDAVGSFFGALGQRGTWVRVLQVVGGAGLMVAGVAIVGHGVIGDVATELIPAGKAVKAAGSLVK